jgi:tetratricopeptide (TPR) repeat protein
LESIPDSNRTVRTLKQLASVYDHFGEIKSAIECYKSIIQYISLTRLEPYAIEAVVSLLNYGVSSKEIRPMLPPDTFFTRIANAYHLSHSNSLPGALNEMRQLQEEHSSNPWMLCLLGQMLRKAGDNHAAKQLYVKLRRLEPDWVEGMDVFAVILREEGNSMSLNRLATDLLDFAENRPETLVTIAILHEMKGEYEDALKAIDNALKINGRYYFAHQMRGKILMAMNRYGEASLSFRNAYGITRDIFTYEGLVNCYIGLGKMLEATSTAKEALALLPSSPRATCLAGVVMTHNPSLINKVCATKEAKEYFEKALKMDPKSLETLFALSDLHVVQGNLHKAIEL